MKWPRRRSPKTRVPDIDWSVPAPTPLYLGFPGLGGRNDARRMIPGMLLHCPGLLLLHDPIYVSESLFSVDNKSILETTQYRLALRLVEKGVVHTLPGPNEAFESDLRAELTDLTDEFLRGSGFNVPRDAVANWLSGGSLDDLSRLGPEEKSFLMSPTTELLSDVCRAQAIAEQLECPYAFPMEDNLIYSIRWSLSERSAKDQVHALIRLPIPEGSVLVTEVGEPAVILPEITYSLRNAMNGRVFIQDEQGNLTPYIEPSWDRSSKLLERVLEVREDAALAKLRSVLASWYRTVREMRIPEPSVIGELARGYEELLMSFRDWRPAYEELGKEMGTKSLTAVLSQAAEVPVPTGPARRASPAKGTSPVFFYEEYFGPTGEWLSPEVVVKRG